MNFELVPSKRSKQCESEADHMWPKSSSTVPVG
ncbi:unannotated protein [freshwater metagenome]|uniref:Unannotated protein n=1 Tax=freshwater metagenome TaxID=449393 RepID=A0A6J7RUV5_9ZZZZ